VVTCANCGRDNPVGARFCNGCAAELASTAVPREVRKTVTVLFCDVTGSTALGDAMDPEALRVLLARYFERMKTIVESHGGVVEKFIGDAVMAVFGIPAAHEDDALRACRTAMEMRDALPELGIRGRIGVNTGEVGAGTEERLATGDAVNVAARLEEAAAPGEVLIGAETRALTRDAVDVEAVEPLSLKGKTEPVPAFRLITAGGELARRFATPMVGRETELRRLRDAFAQAVHDRSCQLFTVLGSAGVGKSRLAAEFLAGIEARVVQGGCLSYGEGITYWPVVEIVKQLNTLPESDAAVPLRSLLGETESATSAEEIAWGFRKLLEQEAQERPLVCLLDDLHWAEQTLLDLVEHIADLSRDAPVLLLCMARPELLEKRPTWGGGKWNATTVLLEPLDAAETERLLDELGGVEPGLRERIATAAEGNPLFLEEMLALAHASDDGEISVPPTIQALLAARLDQLDPAERAVLERRLGRRPRLPPERRPGARKRRTADATAGRARA
jgi:class 3 adenylate cyclase